MTGYGISEVAERTGLPASTLRYYEDIGLLAPAERTKSGYRRYDDRAVDRLRFIARAKRLGLTLEAITDLVELWNLDRCAPVQERLRALLEARQRDTADQIADLETFRHALGRVADRLGMPAPESACDDTCGCVTDPDASSAVPLVCTLETGARPERLAAWHRLAARAVAREHTADGVRLRFDGTTSVAEIADIAAETTCCSFFRFTIGITTDGTTLDIEAPPDARELIGVLVD